MILYVVFARIISGPWTAEISQAARAIIFDRIGECGKDVAEAAAHVARLAQSIGDEKDAEVITARYHLQAATSRLVAMGEAVDMSDPIPDPHAISVGVGVGEITASIAAVRETRQVTLMSRITKAANTLLETTALDTEPTVSLFIAKGPTDFHAAIKVLLQSRMEMGLICLPDELLAVPMDPWACLPDLELYEDYKAKQYALFSAFLSLDNLSPAGLALAQKIHSYSELSAAIDRPRAVEGTDEAVEVTGDPEDVEGRMTQRIVLIVESARMSVLSALRCPDDTLHARVRYLVMWLLASGEKNPMAYFQRHMVGDALHAVTPFISSSVAALQPNLWTRIWHRIIQRRMAEEMEAAAALNAAARGGNEKELSKAADNLLQVRLRNGANPERLLRVPLDPWRVLSKGDNFRLFVTMLNAIKAALTRSSFASTADGIRLVAELEVVRRKAAAFEENDAFV